MFSLKLIKSNIKIMKLTFFEKSFKRSVLTLAFAVIVSISACEDSPERKQITAIALDSFSAKDHGNEGNASDILLFAKLSGSLDKFEKLRFILTSSPATFDIAKAQSLSPASYVEVDPALFTETYLDAGLNDPEGEPVTEGKAYTTFVLLVPVAGATDPILIQASGTFTLKNEIVVISPKFKGAVSADEDISIDQENNLFVSGGKTNPTTLFKISADGTIVQLSTSLNYAVGNTLDEDGNLYVTNYQSTNINRVTPAGVTSVFVADDRLTGGGGIIVDNSGMIYNTFFPTKNIYRISTTGIVESLIVSDKLNGPVGMAYDRINDRIFVSNFNDGKIFTVSKEGSISELTDTPASIGHLDYLDEVLYVTGFNENKVYLVSTSGEIKAAIGSGNKATADGTSSEASFFNPNGIAVSKDGKFVYVSQMDGKIRKIVL
jgi:sugar lactone lactonase YvrE